VVVTVNPSYDLLSTAAGIQYTVTMGVGVLKDAGNNNFAGISGTAYRFTTAEAPTAITTYSPAQGTTGVTVGDNLVLTFNENIQAGTGNIVLTPSSGAVVTIPVGDAQVSITNAVVTVNPSYDLLSTAAGIQYTVTMGVGVFKDAGNNNFAGISGTAYRFTIAPSLLAHKIVQQVTITGVTVSSYAGDTKQVFEAAYAMSISVWDTATKSTKSGCTVISSAVVARRTGVKITFTAYVNSANLVAAKAAAKSSSLLATFIAAVNTANAALGKSVTVPSATAVTTSALTVTNSLSTGSQTADNDTLDVFGILWRAALVAVISGVVCYLGGGRCVPSKLFSDNTEPSGQEAAPLPVGDCVPSKARKQANTKPRGQEVELQEPVVVLTMGDSNPLPPVVRASEALREHPRFKATMATCFNECDVDLSGLIDDHSELFSFTLSALVKFELDYINLSIVKEVCFALFSNNQSQIGVYGDRSIVFSSSFPGCP
jgi:hypothetical protein